jgi:hypothetical protein
MAAYAKKSEGSSGGDSSDGGGGSNGSDDSSSGDGGGSSDEGGGVSSGGSNDNGGSGSTGGDNSLKTEEPNPPPPPPIEAPPPTVEPPPPETCVQGSIAPECSGSGGLPPTPPPGSMDCSTSPSDPSCNTPSGPIDCNSNSNDPSCGTPTPVDCKTNPDDPSCTTTPPPTVDCKANPSDASCTTPPIDCKTTPNDPSCKPDCTKNPDDASCKVDCQANPNDPSCPSTPPCQSAVIGISCPPVDCTKTPNDPSCPPPPICKPDENIVNGKCEKVTCSTGEHYDPAQKKCISDKPPCPAVQKVAGGGSSSDDCKPCPGIEGGAAKMCPVPVCKTGEHRDPSTNKCVPDNCRKNEHYDSKLNKCVPNPPCKNGEYDPVQNKCVQCPTGTKLLDGRCQEVINITIVVHKVVKNSFSTSKPTFLLLLDTAQLCQLAGDTQCVAKQNQFDTLNLVTKLDSTGETWSITGQVENRVSKIQRNVQVVAYFYDSKGDSIGGPYKGIVNPTSLKSLQLGAFSMKPSTYIMKGTPSFIRLEYQSTTS